MSSSRSSLFFRLIFLSILYGFSISGIITLIFVSPSLASSINALGFCVCTGIKVFGRILAIISLISGFEAWLDTWNRAIRSRYLSHSSFGQPSDMRVSPSLYPIPKVSNQLIILSSSSSISSQLWNKILGYLGELTQGHHYD